MNLRIVVEVCGAIFALVFAIESYKVVTYRMGPVMAMAMDTALRYGAIESTAKIIGICAFMFIGWLAVLSYVIANRMTISQRKR